MTSLSLSCLGEGNGNPLQCSCLENPRDDGAWRATIFEVTQSRTRLKQLSSSSSLPYYKTHKSLLLSRLPWWLRGKESACNAGDAGSIPWSGRSPGEGNGNPLQYSCLENPRDGRTYWAAVYGVAQSWTRLKQLSSSSSIISYI